MGCCVQSQDAPSDDAAKTRASTESEAQINKVTIEQFKLEKLVGKGSFGKVFLVTKKDTGNQYAMKVLKKSEIEKRNQRVHTESERTILGDFGDNPFIVKLYYAFQNEYKLYMVMEFMAGGELFFHLRKSGRFTEDRARFYICEIIEAFNFLHINNTIYRDLKPENILLDLSGHVKLSDFGLSKTGLENSKSGKAYTFWGTPEYLAPEILMGSGHDSTADYWSLGALLYEMLTGAPPFYSKNRDEMFRNIISKPVPMRQHFTESCSDLLTQLLTIEQTQRLNTYQAVTSHKWFQGIDWAKVKSCDIMPPFRPSVRKGKLGNFDEQFTKEAPIDSVVDKQLDDKVTMYEGFTYQVDAPMDQ